MKSSMMTTSVEVPVFDVSGALAVLNQTLEYAFPFMTVVGELDSYKVAKGKWVYADIKDDYAKMRIFGTVYMLPGPLEDGMMVEVVGQPRLHPLYGFSFNIQSIRPVGEGSLKKAANLLARKLEAEGLFDPERKRAVLYPPERVGLITSSESAAYADFIKIMNARWQGVVVDVYDVQVQGEAAVESIVSGIQFFNQHALTPDVLVLTRGGGSADDLSAFSTEQVVRAVAGSRIPTCVAIGHEVDESLAELAADMRASTPSNAAELLFPDRLAELQSLKHVRSRLVEMIESAFSLKHVALQEQQERLVRLVERHIDERLQRLSQARILLKAVHPKTALKRGFAIVEDSAGKLVVSTHSTTIGENLKLTFKDGSVQTKVEEVY